MNAITNEALHAACEEVASHSSRDAVIALVAKFSPPDEDGAQRLSSMPTAHREDFMKALLGSKPAGDKPQPAVSDAERFIAGLTGSADTPVTFQTFDDSPTNRPNLARILHGTLAEQGESLHELNQLGAGIFVTVNQTDSKGRKAKNITGVRAVFADFDTADAVSLADAAAAKLPPSIIVESSPGKRHLYWLVDGVTISEFDALMPKLIEAVNSDPAAKDSARVLRVPGFDHNKGEPVPAKLLEAHPERRYSCKQLVGAFDLGEATLAPTSHTGARQDPFAARPAPFWTAGPMRAALKHLDPGMSRSDWRMVGFACLAQLGEVEGFALWNEWSSKAREKYSEVACRREWADMMKRDEHFGVGVMLKLLPEGTVAEIRHGVGVPPQGATMHPLADFTEAEPEGDTRDGEFVLDYLIAAGMALVAGAPGAGKTTQLIPLMTVVAHACPPEHELLPELRRNVIYITEDPAQARNIIASLRDAGWFGALSKRDVGERFKIVTAKRLSSEVIAEVSSIYLAMGVTNTNPETGDTHVAHPVVVFDTTSATIELGNENDNAEVGSAVASLKENFASKGIPVILVAHIAKNLNRADVSELSVRGASAWIGDVQQVMFLLRDTDDENKRWLEIAHPVAKHRFEPMGDGIEFDLCTRTIHSTSVLGRVREVKRSHGVPKLIIRGQRLTEKHARADLKQTAAANAMVGKIRNILQAHQDKADMCYMTKNEVAKEVEGGKTTILATIDKMVHDKILEFADFNEFPKRHHTHTVGYRVRVAGF